MKIEDRRMVGVASGFAFGYDPTGRSAFLIKSNEILNSTFVNRPSTFTCLSGVSSPIRLDAGGRGSNRDSDELRLLRSFKAMNKAGCLFHIF